MDFVIIANQWDVYKDNPTSKHHIAMELVRAGHRVLWVVGTGMRRPSVGSSVDRGRILRKVKAAVSGIQQQALNIEHRTSNTELPSDNNTEKLTTHRLPSGQANNQQLTTGSLWTLAPLVIPLPGNEMVRKINEGIYLKVVGRAVKKLGFEKSVLINFLPTIPGVHKGWREKSIYYCVDRWSAFSEYDTGLMDRLDAECCGNADMVIASARDLEERCKKHNNNTHLVLHGVDYEHFRIRSVSRRDAEVAEDIIVLRPRDLPEGKIVGFFGHISDWLDQDLVVKLGRELNQRTEDPASPNPALRSSSLRSTRGFAAASRGQKTEGSLTTSNHQLTTSIVLIGRHDVDVSKMQAEENIHLLGQKDYEELPGYVAHFDVGMIPFVINDLTRALNPIKLREMLAAGCRVVSTALPEVEGLTQSRRERGGVYIGQDGEEFVGMVKKCLDEPLSVDEKKRLSESMQEETWEAKVGEIVGIVSGER